MFRPLGFVILSLGIAAQASADRIDPIFAGFTAATPGCALGVETANGAMLVRAYGSTDLEHGIANTPDTVFEAGSVSKQFTAAAVLLLAQEHRIALTDDIRRYIPELPDYGTRVTIADLLSHTSGLRDWGEVEDIAGWPRGDRVYGLADVLRITADQRHLNYRPGTDWSYTNTGYNLAAILVERVSGKSLAAFTHDHLFVPLGMTHTRWRDDFRRVEPGRAIAYSRHAGGAFEQDMPFENAYGNGGLLTTVSDLLAWNRALSENRLGETLTRSLATPTRLADGRIVDYGKGLFVQRYLGQSEIAHSGATAGYRAWLGRYPREKLSIALLCNDGNVDPTRIAHEVATVLLPPVPAQPSVSAAEESRLAQYAGWYAGDRSGAPLHLWVAKGRVVSSGGEPVEHDVGGGFRVGAKPIAFLPDGLVTISQAGAAEHYRRVAGGAADARTEDRIVGRYRSAEAEVTYHVFRRADGLHLQIEGRPDHEYPLIPAYANAFTFDGKLLKIDFGSNNAPPSLDVITSRVWKMHFDRLP